MIIESDKKGLFWKREEHFTVRDWRPAAEPFKPNDFFSESKSKTRVLQWDGGGILGVLGLYMMYNLEYHGLDVLNFFNAFWGASTGAIIVTLLNLQWKAKEILRWYIEKGPWIFQQRAFAGGLIGAKYKKDNIRKTFREHMGNITLKELYERTGKELNIGVVNMTDERHEVWNHNTHPHVRLRDAVIISLSAPVYFTPETHGGKIYCDGGTGAMNCLANKAYNREVYDHDYKPSDVYIMSVGCGKGKLGLPRRGKLSQAIWTFLYGRAESIENQEKFLRHRAEDDGLVYDRWDIPLPKKLNEMDDTDNINELIALVDRLF